MKIHYSVAITIISILSLQTFVLSILLLIKNRNKQANILLALVLIFFGLTALNLALFYGLILSDLKEIIPYLRLELLYGLGPSLYFYTKSVTNPEYKIHKREYLHFLPVLLEFIYYRTSLYRIGAIYLLDSPKNIYNVFFIYEQWIGFITATIYMIFAVKLLFEYKKWLHDNFSNILDKTLQWLNKPVIVFVLFWCLWFGIRLVDMFLYSGAYSNLYYYPMFILLSVITLWIGFQGYFKAQIGTIGFSGKRNLKHTQNDSDNNYSDIINLLKESLEKGKFYLDQDFDMTSFSNKTGIPSKLISKAINSELKINFHEFINQYRVNEFKIRIKNSRNKNLTLLGHAFDSGFASKSTFNHIFKKYTLLTPKQYYQKIHKKMPENMSENMISDD